MAQSTASPLHSTAINSHHPNSADSTSIPNIPTHPAAVDFLHPPDLFPSELCRLPAAPSELLHLKVHHFEWHLRVDRVETANYGCPHLQNEKAVTANIAPLMRRIDRWSLNSMLQPHNWVNRMSLLQLVRQVSHRRDFSGTISGQHIFLHTYRSMTIYHGIPAGKFLHRSIVAPVFP